MCLAVNPWEGVGGVAGHAVVSRVPAYFETVACTLLWAVYLAVRSFTARPEKKRVPYFEQCTLFWAVYLAIRSFTARPEKNAFASVFSLLSGRLVAPSFSSVGESVLPDTGW